MRVVLKSNGKPIAKKDATREASPRNGNGYGNGVVQTANDAQTGNGNLPANHASNREKTAPAETPAFRGAIRAASTAVGLPVNRERDAVHAPLLQHGAATSVDAAVAGDAIPSVAGVEVSEVHQQIEGMLFNVSKKV